MEKTLSNLGLAMKKKISEENGAGHVIDNRQDRDMYLRYNAQNKSTYKYTKPKG